jgi:hypothetical protein
MKSPVLVYLIPMAALGVGVAGGWFTAPKHETAPQSAESTVGTSAKHTLESEGTLPATKSASAGAMSLAVDSSLEAAMSYPSTLHRRAALKRYFDALDLASFDAAFSKVSKMGEIEPEVLDMFARAWAERAPEAAARALLTLPAGPQRGRTLSAFVRAWGRRDSAAASAWAEKALTGQDLQLVRSYLKSRTAQGAPETPKTFAEIMAIAGRDERQVELGKYLRKVGETDPAKALEQALELPSSQDRASLRVGVSSNWVRKDPAGFLQWLKNRESASQWRESEWTDWTLPLSTATSELISKDPNQVRQIIDGWKDGKLKDYLATTYSSRLAYSDPDAAIAFVEEMKLRNPEFSYASILPGIFEKDPEKGKELLKTEVERLVSKNSYQSGEYTVNLMKNWIAKDAGAAAEFARSLPVKVMPDVFYAISKEWCIKDGQAALDWAATLPSGTTKEHAFRQFTYTWSKHDTKKSTAWLNSLPQDAHRWAATEGFVFSTLDTDPDGAIGWARTIPDEKKRLDIVARAWSSWNRNNWQSAFDWLENGDLSEGERDAILRAWR